MRVAVIQSETRFMGGIERITAGILAHSDWPDIDWHAAFLRPGFVVDRLPAAFPRQRVALFNAGRLRNVPRTALTVMQLARQLRRWKIDAVLSQGFHAQCYGGPAARLAGARNIFWCHNLLRTDHEFRDPIVRLATRVPVDMVLGFPRCNLPNLEQAFARRCPVRLLYPAHPMQNFASGDGNRIRREFGIPSTSPVAVIIGRLQPWKGQDVFVRAAARVAQRSPDVQFIVVGGTAMAGDVEFEASLKHHAQQAGIADRVIFTGERHDVPDFLAAADVVVHASVDPEPFGLVITEAMAAGCAVIATNAGGPAEIIEHGTSGLLTTPASDEELAASMLRLFDDTGLREQLGRNAASRVATRFSFERMVERLSSVLHDVGAGPSATQIVEPDATLNRR